jgi:hypothetical protein
MMSVEFVLFFQEYIATVIFVEAGLTACKHSTTLPSI